MPDGFDIFLTADNKPLKSGLYLVATPIGNMGDITLRAIETLKSVSWVACEDTRVSGQLLTRLGIKKKLISLHDHNEESQASSVMHHIMRGESVALISDAGMPLIADPGYKLVRACRAAGLYVTSCPGANAPLMALQLSGIASDAFSFIGFLPAKSKARRDVLGSWANVPTTLIAFETAPRLQKSLADILAVLGNRPLTLARELTKKFEDIWEGDVENAISRVERDGVPKGEIVLVIGREDKKESGEHRDNQCDTLLKSALETMSVKEAVAHITEVTGLPKKHVYARALEIKNSDGAV